MDFKKRDKFMSVLLGKDFLRRADGTNPIRLCGKLIFYCKFLLKIDRRTN